jgi:hypothetical protein
VKSTSTFHCCFLPVGRLLRLAVLADVFDEQAGVEHEVLGVGLRVRMPGEPEGAPRHHGAEVAAGLGARAFGAQRLHAQRCQVAALCLGIVGGGHGRRRAARSARRRKLRMPLVDLAVGLARGAGGVAARAQVRAGAGVVVVAGGVAAAGQAARGHEAVDVLGIGLPAGRVVFDLAVRVALGLPVRGHRVRQHQPVRAPRMREVVADAPFLAQPAEEVEVAFVELRLVVAHRVALEQPLVDRKPIAGEQFIEDVHDGLVLEDPAVRAQGGQVKPGAQREAVLDVPAFLAPHARTGDQCVELAGRRAVEFDLACQLAADERIEIEVRGTRGAQVQRVRRLEQQFVFEQCIDALPARQAHGLERRAAENNGNGGTLDVKRARRRHRCSVPARPG